MSGRSRGDGGTMAAEEEARVRRVMARRRGDELAVVLAVSRDWHSAHKGGRAMRTRDRARSWGVCGLRRSFPRATHVPSLQEQYIVVIYEIRAQVYNMKVRVCACIMMYMSPQIPVFFRITYRSFTNPGSVPLLDYVVLPPSHLGILQSSTVMSR